MSYWLLASKCLNVRHQHPTFYFSFPPSRVQRQVASYGSCHDVKLKFSSLGMDIDPNQGAG